MVQSTDLDDCIARALDPGMNSGMYGSKVIASTDDRWSVVVSLAEAAAAAATCEWLLIKRAGTPHKTRKRWVMATRQKPPYRGFHLNVQFWCWPVYGAEPPEVDPPDGELHGTGYAFPLTRSGLRKALLAAREAETKSHTVSATLTVCWSDYLPDQGCGYLAPFFRFERDELEAKRAIVPADLL